MSSVLGTKVVAKTSSGRLLGLKKNAQDSSGKNTTICCNILRQFSKALLQQQPTRSSPTIDIPSMIDSLTYPMEKDFDPYSVEQKDTKTLLFLPSSMSSINNNSCTCICKVILVFPDIKYYCLNYLYIHVSLNTYLYACILHLTTNSLPRANKCFLSYLILSYTTLIFQ